ncbi:MAG: YSC84-related protein [Pseudomonadota bacterium]
MLIAKRALFALVAVVLASTVPLAPSVAADREVIDAKISVALRELREKIPGADDLLQRAKGVLVMPDVTEAGLVVGGTYGEGALLIDGIAVQYYSVAGAQVGLLAGFQTSSQALLFLTDEALAQFRESSGWEAGVSAKVAVVTAGTGTGVDTLQNNEPIIAFVWGQAGLLANVSLDGSKYTRIDR